MAQENARMVKSSTIIEISERISEIMVNENYTHAESAVFYDTLRQVMHKLREMHEEL